MLLLIPSTALGFQSVKTNIKNNSGDSKIKFLTPDYELVTYATYNKSTKKVETNLQVKNRLDNKVNIFKQDEYKIGTKFDSSNTYIIEIPYFGQFTIQINSAREVTHSEFLSFSNASALKIQKRNVTSEFNANEALNNINDLQNYSQILTSDIANQIQSVDQPENQNKSNMSSDSSKNTIKSENNPKVLIIGDSNSEDQLTDAAGMPLPDNFQQTHIKNRDLASVNDKSWVQILDQRLDQLELSHDFINISSGATRITNYDPSTDLNTNAQSLYFLDTATESRIRSLMPIDILIIDMGTNDAIELRDVNEFIREYRNFVVNFIENYGIKNIIVVAPPVMLPVQIGPNNYFVHPNAANLIPVYRTELSNLQRSLTTTRQYSAMNISFVDTVHLNPSHLQSDNVHLNNNGESGLADLIQPSLMQLIEKLGNSK